LVVAATRRRPEVLDERDAGARFGCREAEQEGERQRRRGARSLRESTVVAPEGKG